MLMSPCRPRANISAVAPLTTMPIPATTMPVTPAIGSGMPVSPLAEKFGLDCASCHRNREPHRDPFGRECGTCHETSSWRIAGFLYASPASKECAQRHQAPLSHYMMHFQMIDMARSMHRSTSASCAIGTVSWNDIKGVGWFKHN